MRETLLLDVPHRQVVFTIPKMLRWLRGGVGRAHSFFIRLLFPRLKVKDPDAGFKGFDLAWLQKMCRLSRMDRWSWDLEILAIARSNGLTIKEIPINWDERYEAYASSVQLVRDA
jgi:hypothetical protein